MDRDFEKFNGGPSEPMQSRLNVTLRRVLSITLNRNAYVQLGRPAAVRLYFSRVRDCIGIEPTSPTYNDAFPVMPNGASGWRINSAPFCRHFNIVPDTTLKFISPEFDGASMLLKLGQTISVARPKRRRKPNADSRRA